MRLIGGHGAAVVRVRCCSRTGSGAKNGSFLCLYVTWCLSWFVPLCGALYVTWCLSWFVPLCGVCTLLGVRSWFVPLCGVCTLLGVRSWSIRPGMLFAIGSGVSFARSVSLPLSSVRSGRPVQNGIEPDRSRIPCCWKWRRSISRPDWQGKVAGKGTKKTA